MKSLENEAKQIEAQLLEAERLGFVERDGIDIITGEIVWKLNKRGVSVSRSIDILPLLYFRIQWELLI